jgi:uncharacterized protein (TIGR03067 family)
MSGRTSALLVGALVLAGSSFAAIAGDAKDGDSKAIQGAWSFTKGDDKIKLTFDGNKFQFEFKGATVNGTFKLDAAKKPRAIDMTVTKGSDEKTKAYEGKTARGIYQIEGDKLKWCSNEPGKDERPSAFPAVGEKTMGLFVTFERQKK